MTTSVSFSSCGKPFTWIVPVALVAVLAGLSLAIAGLGQQSLQAPGPGGVSASTLFNQANADAHAGKTAPAIVGYERAQFLAPTDGNIRANLNWTRSHAGLANLPETWEARAVAWASPNTMAWLGSLGLILLGASWVLARPGSKARVVFRLAGLVGALLVTASITSAVVAWQTSRETVVVTADAPARISPTTVSEVSFKLPLGGLVSVQGRHGDFVLVADASGHTGWVNERDVESILPAPSAGLL